MLNMNTHKLAQVRDVMRAQHVETLVVNRSDNFAWLTDGASSYINIASDTGAAALVVTMDNQYVVCDNIEVTRLQAEEELAGWEFVVGPWHDGRAPLVRRVATGSLGADTPFPDAANISAHIAPLRYQLDAREAERFRIVGAATGHAVQAAARAVKPGMSENEIAGLIAQRAYAHDVVPIVVLVASDERIFNFRHPLPTEKRLDKYAMLIVCGRRWGLVASATRLVHFGKLSDELRRKADACAAVDAAFTRATKRGATLGDVFQAGMREYAAQGFDGEWQHHHQGGLAGYASRETLGTPTSTQPIDGTMAFAWNPSIKGVKSEDSLLLTDGGVEIVTQVGDWPLIAVGGIERPDILVNE